MRNKQKIQKGKRKREHENTMEEENNPSEKFIEHELRKSKSMGSPILPEN